MTTWLLRSIGVGDEIQQHLDKAQLAFQHPLILWVGLVLLVPIGVLIFRRQSRNLGAVPSWVTTALSITRILILALLVLALSGPYLKLDYKLEKKPIVAVLFDDSASMDLPAGPFEKEEDLVRIAKAAGYQTAQGKVDAEARKALNRISRVKLAQLVVQTAAPALIKPLVDKYDVRYASFARELHPLNANPLQGAFPELAIHGGSATQLGDAIAKVLDDAGGQPVAGIVVFSDGQNNGGQPPAEAARRAAGVGAPIFTVPPGPAAVVRDVSVVDVSTSGQVALGDKARVTATLQSQGLDGKSVTVQLLDGLALLDSKELVLRGGEQQQIELTFEATHSGTRSLTVNVPPLPDEPEYLRANNSDIAIVRVSREKIKVLYLDGPARWDFRFLKNAMRRDHGLAGRLGKEPDIFLEAELRRRPPEQVAAVLPATLADLAAYHTVILGDASPQLLDAAFVKLLAEAVRTKGVGLIVMAGPLAMPHLFNDQLQDLLPVRLHPRTAGLEGAAYRPFRLELTPQGAIHEVMRLYEETDRNQNAWARMPPYYWCAAADSPSAGATVLAWNPDVGGQHGNLPLIAYHYAGDGKVLFVGTDSTWLWRQNVGDRFFYRFWGQAIRFVARRDETNRELSSIEVRPLRLHPREPAQIELLALDAGGAPRTDRKLSVAVFDGKSVHPVEVAADDAKKGRYTGTFTPDHEGDYRLTFDAGAGAAPVEARLRVLLAAEELRQPGVNRAMLELVAGAGSGKLVELPDLASIPPQLKGEIKLTQVHRESTIWDNWLMLVTLVGIYSLDVGLRRFRGLA